MALAIGAADCSFRAAVSISLIFDAVYVNTNHSCSFFGMFFLPYSPRWLCDKSRNEEALQTLARLHADGNVEDPYVLQEYNEIVEYVKFEREHAVRTYRDLFSKQNRRRVMLAVGIQSMQVRFDLYRRLALVNIMNLCFLNFFFFFWLLAMDWYQRW